MSDFCLNIGLGEGSELDGGVIGEPGGILSGKCFAEEDLKGDNIKEAEGEEGMLFWRISPLNGGLAPV